MPIEEQAEEKIQNAVQTIITGGAKLMLRIPKGVAMALLRSGMKLTKTGVRAAGEAVKNKIDSGEMSEKRLQRKKDGDLHELQLDDSTMREVQHSLKTAGIDYHLERTDQGQFILHFAGRDEDHIRAAVQRAFRNMGLDVADEDFTVEQQTEQQERTTEQTRSEPETPARTPLCGHEEHAHTADCYDETGTLTCGKTEHIHGENCQFPESRSFTYEDEALSMTVTVLSPDPLPEDAELTVTEASEATLQEAETYADENDAALLAARRLTLRQGDEPIDTTDFRMTAEVQVREELLDQLREQAATFAADAPETETEAVITLSALQPQEEDLAQQASVQVETEKIPPLTLTLRNDEVVVMASSEVNPQFTVQYYAELPMLANSGGSKTLPVFDTTGGTLPKNHSDLGKNVTDNKKKNLQLKAVDNSYEVLTTTELRQLYRTETDVDFTTHPNLVNVNKLNNSSNYTLARVLVRQDGKQNAKPGDVDWETKNSDVQFTNDPSKADANTIFITNETVLCLVYTPQSGSYTNSTTFYDYDITDGNTGNLNSQQKGINSASNYSGSGEKFAFGNANCGTGMQNYTHDGIYMNQYSITMNKTYTEPQTNYGCNFGLVKGLANGKLVYDKGVIAPYRRFRRGQIHLRGQQVDLQPGGRYLYPVFGHAE